MPRLVDDAVRVVARVTHRETVAGGVGNEPGERVGRLERFLGRWLARRTDVAFEIDDVNQEEGAGWSVLVRGSAAVYLLPARSVRPGRSPFLVMISVCAFSSSVHLRKSHACTGFFESGLKRRASLRMAPQYSSR